MSGKSLCFIGLPGATPTGWAAEGQAGEEVSVQRVALSGLDGDGDAVETEAAILAPRLLPRLFREPAQAGSPAEAALADAQRIVLLLPAGRYDDGVWAPIVERILRGLEQGASRPREVVLVWNGLDPFLAPFGARAGELWRDPRLVTNLLAVLERSARSLAAVLREFAGGEGLAIRRGLIRFEAGTAGQPPRAALALA